MSIKLYRSRRTCARTKSSRHFISRAKDRELVKQGIFTSQISITYFFRKVSTMIMGERTVLTLIRSIVSGKLGKNRLSGIKQQGWGRSYLKGNVFHLHHTGNFMVDA